MHDYLEDIKAALRTALAESIYGPAMGVPLVDLHRWLNHHVPAGRIRLVEDLLRWLIVQPLEDGGDPLVIPLTAIMATWTAAGMDRGVAMAREDLIDRLEVMALERLGYEESRNMTGALMRIPRA